MQLLKIGGGWVFQTHFPVFAGVIAGGIGLVLSFAGRGLVPGRLLGDPLPLALAAGQILRSILYFNWQALLFHILFAAFLGVLTALIMRLSRPDLSRQDAARAGRIAAVINVGIVAMMEVDALMVGFWYLAAGYLSVLITGFFAGKTADFWPKRGSRE